MTNSVWLYASNQFDVATRGSFITMNVISADTAAKLQNLSTIPAIEALHVFFHPIRNAFASAYEEWMATSSKYYASTQVINDQLSNLSSTLIEDWDVRIQVHHKPRTARYKELMPNGRTAFMNGGKDHRISVVAALARNLADEPKLASLRAEVQECHDQLNASRLIQQGLEGRVAELSSALEHARLEIAAALYYVLGGLMMHYHKEPAEIQKFFDLENLRQKKGNKTEYVDPAVILLINAGTSVESGLNIAADAKLLLRNTGTAALQVCLTGDANTPCPAGSGLVLNPGEELETSTDKLGLQEGGYLHFTNSHATAGGQVEVYLL